MNLQIVRPGETASSADAKARGADALIVPPIEPLPPHDPLSLFVSVDASSATHVVCKQADGEETTVDEPFAVASVAGQHTIACPHDADEVKALDERVKAAARIPSDGVLVDAPEAWYVAGRRGAGFCTACETRMGQYLATAYAEQYTPGAVLPELASAPDEEKAPFWREHAVLRWRSSIEQGSRLTRRIRDQVRLDRNAETQVGARLLGFSPAAVALARKMDFIVLPAPKPVPDRSRVAVYEIFRAAMDQRPIAGTLEADAARHPGLVLQAARLASACNAELTLPLDAPEESHAALAAQRRFWSDLRTHYRPADRLAEVLLLYSPECDHWTEGRHGGGVRALAEALTRLGAQYRVVLSVPRTGTEPVVIADAAALPEEDAARLERRVTEGASAIMIGKCGVSDDEGRPMEGPFGDLSSGLNREGAGNVFVVDLQPPAGAPPVRRWEPLVNGLDKALESLLGRGRRAAGVSSPSLIVKMYLDPDRKLDVHLVGRQFDAATGAPEELKGVTLHLAGAAVSGARSGFFFSPEAPEKKITLTPFGMGVQTTLPDFAGSAILTISR